MRDHKLLYGVYLRTGIFASLVIFILLFAFVPYSEPTPYKLKHEVVTMIEEISAEIDKYEEPPPKERPKVAVEAESKVAEEEAVETIAATEFKEDIIRTVPTGPEIEVVPYARVEVKPKLIKPVKPKYPEMARKAGIEGKVILMIIVGIDGSVTDARILKSSGNPLLDEAAIAAARKTRWSPAKQRDKPVPVRLAFPVTFNLRSP